MHVVVGYAMHHEEANIASESRHIADTCVLISARIMLRGMHVSFSVDGI